MNAPKDNTINGLFNLYGEVYEGTKKTEQHFAIHSKKAQGDIFGFQLEEGLFAIPIHIKFLDHLQLQYEIHKIDGYSFRAGVFLTQNFSNITKDKFFDKKENFNDNGLYISNVQSQINNTIQKGNEGFRIFYFFSEEIVTKYLQPDVKEYFFKNAPFFNYFDEFQDLPHFKNILKEIFNYTGNFRVEALKSHAKSSFMMMLNNISNTYESHKYNFSDFKVDRGLFEILYEIKDEIILDFSTKPNIEAISKKYGISLNKLEEAFHAIFGYTAYNYYLVKRLEFSEHLLLSEQYSIKEIAYDLGFSDASYFSNSFKKQFGKTPSQYLKEYKYKK